MFQKFISWLNIWIQKTFSYREESDIRSTLLSYCCHQRLPHIWWLETAQIYSLKSSGGHKSEMGLPGLKSGYWQGHLPSRGKGKKYFSASRGDPVPLAPIQPPHHFLPHILSDSDLLPSSFTSENSCGSTGPAWIIMDNLPSSLALKLNHTCMVSLCQVRWHSQVLRIRMQTPLGAITQPQHAASSSTKKLQRLISLLRYVKFYGSFHSKGNSATLSCILRPVYVQLPS